MCACTCVYSTCTIVHSCLLYVVLVSTSCELLASPVSVLQNDTVVQIQVHVSQSLTCSCILILKEHTKVNSIYQVINRLYAFIVCRYTYQLYKHTRVTHLTDTMVLVVCCMWTLSIKLLCSLSVCSKLSEDRRMRG